MEDNIALTTADNEFQGVELLWISVLWLPIFQEDYFVVNFTCSEKLGYTHGGSFSLIGEIVSHFRNKLDSHTILLFQVSICCTIYILSVLSIYTSDL